MYISHMHTSNPFKVLLNMVISEYTSSALCLLPLLLPLLLTLLYEEEEGVEGREVSAGIYMRVRI